MENKKFKELTNDIDFMEKVLESRTEQEVRNLFLNKGVTLDEHDIQELSDAIHLSAKRNGIVPDEELENVSGGVLGATAIGLIGGAVGFAVGGGVAGIGGLIGSGVAFKRGMDYSDSWWNKILGGSKSTSITTTTVKNSSK